MEPNSTPTSPMTPPQAAQTQVSAAPQANDSQRPPFLAVLCLVLALVFAGTTAYLYIANKGNADIIAQSSLRVAQLEDQIAKTTTGRPVTLVGPLTNGSYKVDDNKLIFVDSNGGLWFVNHTAATFTVSASSSPSFKDASKFSTKEAWLDAQNTLGTHGTDIPGKTVISGTFRNDTGIVNAESIEVTF